jgi:acetyl esterase/lipase
MLSGVDPLKDDGLFFLNRLIQNKVKCKALEMKMMPHGFMSYYYRVQGLP